MLFKFLLAIQLFVCSLYGAWAPPLVVSGDATNTTSSNLAINDQGTALAIWDRILPPPQVIQASSHQFGSPEWFLPQDLSVLSELPNLAQVAISNNGTGLGVWDSVTPTDPIPVKSQINGKRYVNGLWDPGIIPFSFNVASQNNTNPHTVMDDQGSALVVWQSVNAANISEIQAAGTLGGLFAPGVLSNPLNIAVLPSIASGNDTDAVVVWTEVVGMFARIAATTLSYGGVQGLVEYISPNGQNAILPKVACDSSGNAVAVWISNGRVQSSSKPLGGNWTFPTTLSPLVGNAISVDVAVSPVTGYAVAVWGIQIFGTIPVQTASLPLGGVWSSPSIFPTPNTGSPTPVVGVDGKGNAVIVWRDAPAVGTGTIVAATWPIGQSPSVQQQISPTGDATNPRVVINKQGFAIALWNLNFGTTITQASDGFDLFIPLPPNNFHGTVIKNKFASQTQYDHKLRWDPSTDPSVVSYELFRDGKRIAKFPATGPFKFLDEDRPRCKQEVYRLVSLNVGGNESHPRFVVLPPN